MKLDNWTLETVRNMRRYCDDAKIARYCGVSMDALKKVPRASRARA